MISENLAATAAAVVAEQLLLGHTCDTCRWRRGTDRAEGGRLVLVAEICLRKRRAIPEWGICEEWAGSID